MVNYSTLKLRVFRAQGYPFIWRATRPRSPQGKAEAWTAAPSPTLGIFLLVMQPEAPNICKTYDSRVETKPKPLQKRACELNE